MGLFKEIKKFGKDVWDVARFDKSILRVGAKYTEKVLGDNFISNTLRSTDRDLQKAVEYVGGWDNVALMTAALVLGPWGATATGATAAGTTAATAVPTLHGVLSAGEAIGAAAYAGYSGHQEYKAIEKEKEMAAEYAKANAEYNAKVAAEEEKARQARRAGLLATKKSLTKNITKVYQGGSGGATSTDLNVGSIVLG